jgi:hypothetical protein
MSNKWIYALFIIGLVLSACAPLGGTLEVGVIPETQETTLEVVPTAIPPTPTLEPIPDTGVVMGKICFPSEFIPSMTVYFQDITTGAQKTRIITRSNSSLGSMSPSLPCKAWGKPHSAACILQQLSVA